MIYVDIDGVLRDLCGAAGINPTTWNCKIGKEEQSFTDYFTEHTWMLVIARTTEYFEAINFYHRFIDNIVLLSMQPKSWQEYTEIWLSQHFEDVPPIIYTSNKLDYLTHKDDLLIEDNPNLSDYLKILLIDRPYNQEINLPHKRVNSPRQLVNELLRRKYELK